MAVWTGNLRELICPVTLGYVKNMVSFFFFFPFLTFLQAISSINRTAQQLRPQTEKKKKKCNDTWVNDWALLNPQGIRLTIPFDLKNQSASC